MLSAGELVAQLTFKLQDARVELQRYEVHHRQADHRVTANDRTAQVRVAQITQGIEGMMIRKPAGRPLGDTEYLLEQWGWWRMDGIGLPSYISPTFALMRQAMAKNASSRTYCITDDWALAIDKAVAKLAHRDQQMGDIIWLYYGAKWAMVKVGKSYGISEGKARELARAGAAWIDCALCEIREAA